jgi:hypothetical protein
MEMTRQIYLQENIVCFNCSIKKLLRTSWLVAHTIDNGAGSRSSRVVCALSKAQLQDGYVAYPWEKKMREMLPVPSSSSFLSILVLPTALDRANSRYNSVDDTLARANAWFLASQASGVPIAFLNVQTEALLTKVLS